MFQRMALGTSGWVCVCLLVATVHGQDRLLPELPQANSPVTLVAGIGSSYRQIRISLPKQ
jgi:hypothetical protein